jgi:hypothetical protein
MFRLNYLVATCLLALTVGTANADTYTTFNASGTFTNEGQYINDPILSLSGTLTIDVTAGSITAVDLFVENNGTGFAPFNILFSNPNTSQPLIAESSDNTDYLYLSFAPSSLIGFNGGPIQSGHTIEINTDCTGCDYHALLSGSLTTTPLPAALPLFAGGLGVIGLLARRRKRKHAAVLAAA